jgi:glycosyltransferase involved in cell wall biosynthesis
MDGAHDFVQEHRLEKVELLGRCDHVAVLNLMKSARFLVLPSECFENFPMTIAEAYACGLPVVASRLGAMEELVIDGETGLHFTPGNAADLAAKVSLAWGNKSSIARMGHRARVEYETKYTAERNYQQLMGIYRQSLSTN